jgi:hypothetical protein
VAITEKQRHDLYNDLEATLGSRSASVLMEHLPPVGWADVATRRDLDALEERMDLRFDRVDDRFGRVDDRFSRVDDRFSRVEDQMGILELRLEARLERLERVMTARLLAMVVAVVSAQAALLTLLGG